MPKLPCISLLVCALLWPALPLQAQPFLVEDIRTGELPAEWPSDPEFVDLGGIALFTAFDRIHGTELWRSDGTPGGTSLVRDVCPGICSSSPALLTVAAGSVFFRADDGAHGISLWKSDGTEAGTALVEEIEPFELAEVNGLVAFAAVSAAQGRELWRSDGTAAGTFSLGDLRPGGVGSVPQPLGRLGSLLLFRADDGVHGRELWKTDGTVAGTAFVEDVFPGPDSAFPLSAGREGSAVAGGKLVFRAFLDPGSGGYKLWSSDGTASGTGQIKDVTPVSDLGTQDVRFVKLGDEVFFSTGGVWKTDGTEAGTVHVASPGSGYASELIVAGNRIFFKTASGFYPDAKLHVTDGTEAGTMQVPLAASLVDYGSNGFRALGDKLVFFAGNFVSTDPWTSDGTEAGTVRLADLQAASWVSIAIGDLWLFRARTLDGEELWMSDGTPAGTELLKRIDQSDASGLEPETEEADTLFPAFPAKADLAGTLLFAADDGSAGRELWSSDGTEAGTSLLEDLNPSGSGNPRELTPFDGKVFFTGNTALWSSDGTGAGTAELAPPAYIASQPTPAGNRLFYTSTGFGGDLWKLDAGAPEATRLAFFNTIDLRQLTALGSNLFFTGPSGGELWRSDGTEAGTAQFTDINPMGPSAPGSLVVRGSSLYFSAYDGSTGRELWKSDGTPAGTIQVKDIVPGAGSSNPRSMVAAGNLVYFVADDGSSGTELWRSDGTAAGTFRVKDIRPGPESSFIQGLTAFGDIVLFAADDGVNGQEPWMSYGFLDAAFMVKDIRPGAGSSFPGAFRVVGHTVLFAADDGVHGLEPWRTDGFAAGTFLVHDVFPGPGPSSPTGFLLSGDYLYFTANDGAHGFELWALDRAALGSTLAATKRVVSPAFEGGTVTFEIVITNTGAGPHPDNPGDEMVDILPAPLDLTGASADVGTVSLDFSQNRVAWNGALDPGESATVTIEATVASFMQYQSFSNQATLSFDSDGDGVNESAGVSDDPGRSGSGQATPVVVSTPPLDFHTVTPCRLLDTRSSTPLASGVARTITLSGTCGIPATAKAVAANLTVLGATAQGNLVVYPTGIPVPATSNANFSAGQVRANNAQLPLAGGQVNARAFVVGGGTVHLILDVTGYYE
ncbi:MAG: hypothetical protein QOH06_1638 [Acidobacteriota bacterium]|jgi:ELWxxDGT repeat protein|nr:hypothetical protein [Acidobacteriota bacterium]